AAAAGGCEPTHPLEVSAWSATTSVTLALTVPVEGPDYNTLPAATTRPLPADRCKADGSTVGGDDLVCDDFPTLSWDPVPGAVAYRVDVSLTDSFDNIQRVVDTRGTTWTPADDWRQSGADTAYFYAVQACTSKGCGAVPSRPLSFRKSTPRVRAVLPLTGQRPYAAAQDVAFAWTDLADAITAAAGSTTSEAYGYHLVVADRDLNPSLDPSGSLALDVTVDGTLCTTSTGGTAVTDRTTPAMLRCDGTGTVAASKVGRVVRYVPTSTSFADGTYLWKVQAIDASGHKLPFSAPQTFVKDTVAPRVVLSQATGVAPKGAVTATFSEPITPAAPGISLSPATGVTATVSGRRVTLTPTTPYALGALYRLVLSGPVTDLAGNPLVPPLPAFRTVATADDASPALTYVGSWTQVGSSGASSGHYRASVPTTTRPTSATTRGYGTAVRIASCKGPASGQLDVYVDGVKKAHVDTYRSYSGCGLTVASLTGLTASVHTVQVRGLGVRASASRGTSVALDQVTFG
ncbi:MAG: Ig-like domain-containing protein, partial [Pseudorhodobacter sp.]|nr:Ig-like domain-containing protein [Frankiaceae bacterium]